MSGPRLEPVGVADLRMADVRRRREDRGRGVGLLDVHVVAVDADTDRVQAHRADQVDGLLQPVDHVVLVPVERLQIEGDALGARVLAQLGEAGQQHLAVLLLGARRLERGSLRENIP